MHFISFCLVFGMIIRLRVAKCLRIWGVTSSNPKISKKEKCIYLAQDKELRELSDVSDKLVISCEDYENKLRCSVNNANWLKEQLEVAQAEKESIYEAGCADSKSKFMNFSEYEDLIQQIWLQGARDFKKSAMFQGLVEEKVAEFILMAFMKCQSQIAKLGGFKPEFDLNQLDPFKMANLEDCPPPEPSSNEPSDEFTELREFEDE
ncbi:hypothetical protein CDL12_07076 [Handroanthus impetiginosus]|uniref:Uncharacterized protein n=1 Tax=Handroanthus impetiginosus TaxID=429701 RepID=A0A2G9HRT9_9LAMI|nr:hypothetical protein CDL12_07076 [Handroanthus impetiginosus]